MLSKFIYSLKGGSTHKRSLHLENATKETSKKINQSINNLNEIKRNLTSDFLPGENHLALIAATEHLDAITLKYLFLVIFLRWHYTLEMVCVRVVQTDSKLTFPEKNLIHLDVGEEDIVLETSGSCTNFH